MQPYDYAPRLARLAAARRRRHVFFTAFVLMLPALSFQATQPAAQVPAERTVQLAQTP